MIIAEKYRPAMQVTLSDIFHDFNDSRKEMFMLRVKTALEDLQIRMRNELQSNNLANLQNLLKKQQTLKKMEQKLNDIMQQIEQKRQRDNYLSNKINEMQTELNKKQSLLRQAQDRIKALAEAVRKLQAEIMLKDQQMQRINQQKHQTLKQNQQILMEKQKHEQTIRKLRNNLVQKVEETQFILKIKQQKLAESFHQSLTNLQIKNLKERQAQTRNRNQKVDKKNQKIQVNINSSQINTSRTSQMTSRPQPQAKKQNKSVQTQATQQKKISQIIDHSTPNTEKLQQIRLIYSKTPENQFAAKETVKERVERQPSPVKLLQRQKPRQRQKSKYYQQDQEYQSDSYYEQVKRQQPKIIKQYTRETCSISIQTNPVAFKPPSPKKCQKVCQVSLGNYNQLAHQIRNEIEEVKRKHQKMEQFHKKRYEELIKIYEQRPSHKGDLILIESLKLNILELELIIKKKENQLANQRQLFTRTNQSLVQSQNNLLIKRINVKLGESDINTRKVPKVNQTCILLSESPKRMQTQLSNPNIQESQDQTHPRNYTSKIKRRKEDVITITRTKNTLIYSQHRQSSLKSQPNCSQIKKNRASYYQKYSKNRIQND